MNLHPQIAMSQEKELHFFVAERNWRKGVEWYTSNFVGESQIHGEASTSYTMFPQHRGVPERMHSVVPDARLIYLVRDPVERIISDYIHEVARGREQKEIAEALIDMETSPYVARSRYAMQLQRYLDSFPPCRVRILTSEELYHHRRETMQEVFRFAGVEDTSHSRRFSRLKHSSETKRRKTALGIWWERTPVMRAVERWPFGVREKIKAVVYNALSRPIPRPRL
ncbi:MAG: sulfotransferase domain-containing protein, partial [Anaerolineae bacterium]